MSALRGAHLGYEYQDLLVAARSVDVLLGTVVAMVVDTKLFADDLFDDLTTVDDCGLRERTQIKHTASDDVALALETFTTDRRDLLLSRLVRSAIADRDGPGKGSTCQRYRVVVRDSRPTDPRLQKVLRPPSHDPGPFLPNLRTLRMQFDSGALWEWASQANELGERPFRFIQDGEDAITQEDLSWVCERLYVEVEAPAMSGDPVNPGPAEEVLLDRLRTEIGAGLFPNEGRSLSDVGQAFIGAARAARQGRVAITPETLLQRSQLRHDFGAVARAHPVDDLIEVGRDPAVESLVELAEAALPGRRPLLLVGPPGQGKSWLSEQLCKRLSGEGWLVAEHYCYLGDADSERLERVLSDHVFGSLLGRLAEADPSVVTAQRPLYAADEQTLVDAVTRALASKPTRPVAIVVDGVDHITRVRPRAASFDPSYALCEALSALDLPLGSILVVLSQPGTHLTPLEGSAIRYDVPGLTKDELRDLARKLRAVPEADDSPEAARSREDAGEFLDALAERSAGNALYATYLCKEALRLPVMAATSAAAVRALPQFDGTLENYYSHLYGDLGERAWVADTLALVEFGLARSEIKEIRREASHRIDQALDVLAPVLVDRSAQGGVRIYHESFARFIRRAYQDDARALTSLLEPIAAWLQARGLFQDVRAFRSLLAILASAGMDSTVVALVDRDFVERAVAATFPCSAIKANLAVALGAAARLGRWDLVARYLELTRAAETFEDERLLTAMVDYGDVPLAVLGVQAVADRLVNDGLTVMPARAGLQVCAALDEAGGVAPWTEYMTAFLNESPRDNTSYGEESDRAVRLAWLRGRLRMSSLEMTGPFPSARGKELEDIHRPINWSAVASEISKLPPDGLSRAILDTYGVVQIERLVDGLEEAGDLCLAVAKQIKSGLAPVDCGTARDWALKAIETGLNAGAASELVSLALEPDVIDGRGTQQLRDELLELTGQVQERSVQWSGTAVPKWIDACTIAAYRDPDGLRLADVAISGAGWYRCWLHFIVALAQAEASPESDRSRLALEAMRLLTGDLDPFNGEPRACDLYGIQESIHASISRATRLLDDAEWAEGLGLLRSVSDSTTTSLFGSPGGPIPPAALLSLAIETVNLTRLATVAALLEEEIRDRAAQRFYSDLAEYRLQRARLALRAGNQAEATAWWIDACSMLTAYGWHKDITIYELLDPLPQLISSNPAEGRGRVSVVQNLCERVPLHTDGRETNGAWARWWHLLAVSDPVALADLTAPVLFSKCNDPYALLHDARSDVWRIWSDRADPVVSAALRLSIESSHEPGDSALLRRLLAAATDDDDIRLATLLAARIDERSFRSPYSNGEELLAKDEELVDALRSVATGLGVPTAMPPPEGALTGPTSGNAPLGHTRSDLVRAETASDAKASFAAGAMGLSRAIRAWRLDGNGERGNGWTTDRAANIFGYRMTELAENGREADSLAALHAVADSIFYGRGASVLEALGEGLERHGYHQLAAVAFALTWTRTRGHGGWLSFGGPDKIDALERACRIDKETTLRILAEEAEKLVSIGRPYSSYGVTQALIYAFATLDLSLPSVPASLSMAFGIWDEALAVIEQRAPRVDASDDADYPYVPPTPDPGEDLVGSIDQAFAVCALEGLAQPEREAKRRALVATKYLLAMRPTETIPAMRVALSHLSDPATLTWLLALLADSPNRTVAEACTEQLAKLAAGEHLTVRALARDILGDRTSPPMSTPAPELLGAQKPPLWLPDSPAAETSDSTGFAGYLDEVAGTRLSRVEEFLPGFSAAVTKRAVQETKAEGYARRLRHQIDKLSDSIEKRWPDAFLVPEEAIEDALQRVAAGARAALLATGQAVADPAAWERDLAGLLLHHPRIPLALEEARWPRPSIRPPPTAADPIWAILSLPEKDRAERPPAPEAVSTSNGEIRSSLRITSGAEAPILHGGMLDGWRLIGSFESWALKNPERTAADLICARYQVVECRLPGDRQALGLPPCAEGRVGRWLRLPAVFPGGWIIGGLQESQPILGIDHELGGRAESGLGMQHPLLTPTPQLTAALTLEPATPFVLADSLGPALALITWRTDYEVSDYHLPWPRLKGNGVALRGDLLDRLMAVCNGHLTLRDYIVGDERLASAGPPGNAAALAKASDG
jgi:hypothetical protein